MKTPKKTPKQVHKPTPPVPPRRTRTDKPVPPPAAAPKRTPQPRAKPAAKVARKPEPPATAVQGANGVPKTEQPAAGGAVVSQPPRGKLGILVGLLRQPEGASLDAMTAATGWQPHSVRGAMAGALKKKLKLNIVSEKVAGSGARSWRIIETHP